ncbi:MAG: fasciclin domain-containing protein [Candidatus Pedobacter colombiensis]|uniref:Fasciclin domain-containing protein n=1 Tax=Candidatus Pedobacter colombiensis TaxID=3121371 RepID=A0AAJ5WAS2_9SPHI|nr:fasciclin domain-containing protein [Pedobacter sp.]WEK20170.1 MAG: fasciclin domain-containing protein [Pedobacter sp.]
MDKLFKKRLIVILTLIVALASCRKKEFDAYYGRPATLADPIYQQLQARGNFTSLLYCIDKAGYKDILGKSGYWTMFAPNDDAFSKFFKEKGISGVDQIDAITATGIVKYALIFNAFKTDRLGDFQSNAGWVVNSAFKRRTAYYDSVYTEVVNGKNIKIIASNRNGSYAFADNNNKYYPYFIKSYMAANALSAADFNYFFPEVAYTNFNVPGGNVVEANIVAENGVIHVIDKVNTPPQNIDQYLSSHNEYSEFKKVYDRFLVSYVYSPEASKKYQILSGSSDSVKVKTYNPLLSFSPNNENYLKLTDNDGQSNGWTLFAPNNAAFTAYLNSYILEYYSTVDRLPLNVVLDLMNCHMWQSAVWPTRFNNTVNMFGEEARFDPNSNVIDKKILSNGFFYGTNQVQKANVFHTVYGAPYLNPAYSLMIRAMDLSAMKTRITVPKLKYTVLMMNDASLKAAGYDWNNLNSTFQYTPAGGTTVIGGTSPTNVIRMLNTHVLEGEVSSFSGAGVLETIGGEYITYKNNRISSSGTMDSTDVSKQSIPVVKIKGADFRQATNGKNFYVNGLLSFTTKNVGEHLKKYGTLPTDPFYGFYQFLFNNPICVNKTTIEIQGVSLGVNYTVFVPNDAAIKQAVKDDILPGTVSGTTVTPLYNPTTSVDIAKVTKFIAYHILNRNTIATDGVKNGSYETLFKDSNGDAGIVVIKNQLNNLRVTDMNGRTSNVITANSNVLSNRTLIHQIDGYLKYTY